jgi:hypothetical protein
MSEAPKTNSPKSEIFVSAVVKGPQSAENLTAKYLEEMKQAALEGGYNRAIEEKMNTAFKALDTLFPGAQMEQLRAQCKSKIEHAYQSLQEVSKYAQQKLRIQFAIKNPNALPLYDSKLIEDFISSAKSAKFGEYQSLINQDFQKFNLELSTPLHFLQVNDRVKQLAKDLETNTTASSLQELHYLKNEYLSIQTSILTSNKSPELLALATKQIDLVRKNVYAKFADLKESKIPADFQDLKTFIKTARNFHNAQGSTNIDRVAEINYQTTLQEQCLKTARKVR